MYPFKGLRGTFSPYWILDSHPYRDQCRDSQGWKSTTWPVELLKAQNTEHNLQTN